MKVITWNVNVRRDAAGQVAALATYAPDIVALQEVKATRVPGFRARFAEIGLRYLEETASACTDIEGNRCRDRGVLIASRWPVTILPTPPDVVLPWPERLLSLCIHAPHGDTELHNVYVPSVGSGLRSLDVKLLTLERVYQRLACASETPRILCGDFNLPQAETEAGELITFAQIRRARGFSTPQAPWKLREHQAEAAIMRALIGHDLHDVYRVLHGFAHSDASWYGRTTGYRLDHLFAARALGARSCRYLHDLRERRLSDHSALEVVFAPTS